MEEGRHSHRDTRNHPSIKKVSCRRRSLILIFVLSRSAWCHLHYLTGEHTTANPGLLAQSLFSAIALAIQQQPAIERRQKRVCRFQKSGLKLKLEGFYLFVCLHRRKQSPSRGKDEALKLISSYRIISASSAKTRDRRAPHKLKVLELLGMLGKFTWRSILQARDGDRMWSGSRLCLVLWAKFVNVPFGVMGAYPHLTAAGRVSHPVEVQMARPAVFSIRTRSVTLYCTIPPPKCLLARMFWV